MDAAGYHPSVTTGRAHASHLRLVSEAEPARAPEQRPEGPVPAIDDNEIVAALRAGDESAVTALHDRIHPTIERMLLRLLGRRDRDQEELSQRVFVQVIYSMPRYRAECSLDTWTSRITANTVFKELRSRRRARRVFAFGATTEGADPIVDGERAALDRSVLARIQHHLDALDPNKAWTLMLHDVCGYDLKEIAQITEASVTAAQTRLVRGRRELHERIEADPSLADTLRERRRR